VKCSFCGQREADDRFREITGWERKRSTGGMNAVIARKPTGRVACVSCMVDIRAGLPANSPHLFEL